MPPKSHRAGATGIARTHSRSSTASSKALNLQFTQKNPLSAKQVDKTKKNGFMHDSHISKPRAGFTLATTTSQSADEEDEWVSSESGAATPCSGIRSQTPVEPHKTPPLPTTLSADADQCIHRSETPTAQNPSPVRRSPSHPHKRHSATHPSSSSTHSAASRNDAPLRPHPLIRGQSYGHIASATPRMVPLAPLTITSEAAPAQLSTSQTKTHDADGRESTSPSSIETAYAPPPPPLQPTDRRTSVSSSHSATTLPTTTTTTTTTAQVHAHMQPHLKVAMHDRSRTISSISTSSVSIQALSSLAQLPSTTRPSTPQQYASHFPAASLYANANLEGVHPLLPPPYLGAHISILAHRNPLRESYERICAAKEQRQRRGE